MRLWKLLYIKTPVWRKQVYFFCLQKSCNKTSNDSERNSFRSSCFGTSLERKPTRKWNNTYFQSPQHMWCCLDRKLAISEEQKIDTSVDDKSSFDYYQFYLLNSGESEWNSRSSYLDLHKLDKDPNTSPNAFPTLVLNADFQPVSYYPLSLWPWYETIKAVLLEKVVVLESYEKIIRSPSLSLRLPSVVALKEFRRMTGRQPIFTRFNVFLRDDFTCQYCGKRHRFADLSFDHIIPRSRGGKSCWTNVVTACFHCNFKKGSRLIEETKDMKLLKYPRSPTFYELQIKAKKLSPKISHTSWNAYLTLP